MANIEDIENIASEINYPRAAGVSDQSFTIRECPGECFVVEEMKINGEVQTVPVDFDNNVGDLRSEEAVHLRIQRTQN